MYMAGILEVQYFQIGLHNDGNEVVWCANKPTRPLRQNVPIGVHVFRLAYVLLALCVSHISIVSMNVLWKHVLVSK